MRQLRPDEKERIWNGAAVVMIIVIVAWLGFNFGRRTELIKHARECGNRDHVLEDCLCYGRGQYVMQNFMLREFNRQTGIRAEIVGSSTTRR